MSFHISKHSHYSETAVTISSLEILLFTTMSDIDELDFLDDSVAGGSTAFLYPSEPPGTPPPIGKSGSAEFTSTRKERRHRRSLSEQIFSKASLQNSISRSYLRGLLNRRNKSDDVRLFYREKLREKRAGSEGGGESRSDLFDLEWERQNRAALHADFSPFERPQESSIKGSTSGRSNSATYLKNALKRTVKKALSSARPVSY